MHETYFVNHLAENKKKRIQTNILSKKQKKNILPDTLISHNYNKVQTYVVQDFVLFVNKLDPRRNLFVSFFFFKRIIYFLFFTISLLSRCISTKPKLLYASA